MRPKPLTVQLQAGLSVNWGDVVVCLAAIPGFSRICRGVGGGATPTTEGDLLKDSFSPSSAHSCCGAQGMLIIRPQPTRRASDESKLRG